MNRWKTICKRLLCLPGWLLMLLSVISAVGLTAVFLRGWDAHPLGYAMYALSAYTLTVLCVFFVETLPTQYRRAKQRVYDHPLGNRYLTDRAFKVRVSLYCALGINLLYAAFKLIAGVYYGSFWWGAVAVYYMVLSLIRFLLLRHMRSGHDAPVSEYRRYRLTGILMILLHLTLTGVVVLMVRQDQGRVYPEVIIITMAAYTFYTVTMSIVDIVRYRKYHRPVLSAAKAIRFASALVSLLSMETAMLARYSPDADFRRLMTSLTGAAVCMIVLAMSIGMVVQATRAINRIAKEQ